MTATLLDQPANLTRRSVDLVAKFARRGQLHYIALYHLLRLSDLAREGIEHSGSYRFADHLYRSVPSGRGWLGRQIDRLLLALPSSRSMRGRYLAARQAMFSAFAEQGSGPFRLLTVPCGLPRDVRDFVKRVAREAPARLGQIEYTGLDLDPLVVAEARKFLAVSPLAHAQIQAGNALRQADFPAQPAHFISSTGLGDFLDEESLALFYRNAFAALAPGGIFFTSAAARGRWSASILEAFELVAHYRSERELRPILEQLPWSSLEFTRDEIGLQTFVRAVK